MVDLYFETDRFDSKGQTDTVTQVTLIEFFGNNKVRNVGNKGLHTCWEVAK